MVKKVTSLLLVFISCHAAFSQKIDSIYFHLYTDSLKKGFYNYINIDGKYSDDSWLPLTANDIILSANTGRFQGNSLFIDSAYTGETVNVKATLKSNPAVWKQVTIYIRKRPFTEPLKTEEDILNGSMQKRNKRTKNHFS